MKYLTQFSCFISNICCWKKVWKKLFKVLHLLSIHKSQTRDEGLTNINKRDDFPLDNYFDGRLFNVDCIFVWLIRFSCFVSQDNCVPPPSWKSVDSANQIFDSHTPIRGNVFYIRNTKQLSQCTVQTIYLYLSYSVQTFPQHISLFSDQTSNRCS